jgi:hypothetical protein
MTYADVIQSHHKIFVWPVLSLLAVKYVMMAESGDFCVPKGSQLETL